MWKKPQVQYETTIFDSVLQSKDFRGRIREDIDRGYEMTIELRIKDGK